MVEETIKKLYAKHNTWVDIVSSFGCNRVTAEDLVSEMYIKMQIKLEKGLDISYEDEVNYYYVFKTLRTLFLDLKRKEKNIKYQEIDDSEFVSHDANYDSTYTDIQDELDKQYWYDKKIFEIINEGMSIASLSRKTGIRYYSLYNTYTKVKEKLKRLL